MLVYCQRSTHIGLLASCPLRLTDVSWVLVHVCDNNSLVTDECVSTDAAARLRLNDRAGWSTLVRSNDEVTFSVLLNVEADPVDHRRSTV